MVALVDDRELMRVRQQEVGIVANEAVEVVRGVGVLVARDGALDRARVAYTAHRAEQVADIDHASASAHRLI